VACLQNCPGDSMAAAPGRPGCRSAALRLARQACSSYSPALSIWLAAPGLSLHTQTQAWCWCLYASLSRWQHSETGSYTLERRRHTPGWRELGMARPLFGPWAAGPPSDALKALGVPVVSTTEKSAHPKTYEIRGWHFFGRCGSCTGRCTGSCTEN
jgi:hypothetical protein